MTDAVGSRLVAPVLPLDLEEARDFSHTHPLVRR
jgi:hypothetical protein